MGMQEPELQIKTHPRSQGNLVGKSVCNWNIIDDVFVFSDIKTVEGLTSVIYLHLLSNIIWIMEEADTIGLLYQNPGHGKCNTTDLQLPLMQTA